MDIYLNDRAKRIQCNSSSIAGRIEWFGYSNAGGHKPLINNDPEKPDIKDGPQNDYWDHTDYIIKKANSLGIYIGVLPTWGDKWNKNGCWSRNI